MHHTQGMQCLIRAPRQEQEEQEEEGEAEERLEVCTNHTFLQTIICMPQHPVVKGDCTTPVWNKRMPVPSCVSCTTDTLRGCSSC